MGFPSSYVALLFNLRIHAHRYAYICTCFQLTLAVRALSSAFLISGHKHLELCLLLYLMSDQIEILRIRRYLNQFSIWRGKKLSYKLTLKIKLLICGGGRLSTEHLK